MFSVALSAQCRCCSLVSEQNHCLDMRELTERSIQLLKPACVWRCSLTWFVVSLEKNQLEQDEFLSKVSDSQSFIFHKRSSEERCTSHRSLLTSDWNKLSDIFTRVHTLGCMSVAAAAFGDGWNMLGISFVYDMCSCRDTLSRQSVSERSKFSVFILFIFVSVTNSECRLVQNSTSHVDVVHSGQFTILLQRLSINAHICAELQTFIAKRK